MNLPNFLSAVRLALVPVLLWLAWNGEQNIFFVCLVFSLATDFLDGLLARTLEQTTELGAKLDSWADFATMLLLLPAAWWLRPEVVCREATFLIALIVSYVVAVVVGLWKYGRLTSYHTWAGKIAAVILAAAAISFFSGGPSWPLRVAAPIASLAAWEEVAITAILADWRANVPTFCHALRLREKPAR